MIITLVSAKNSPGATTTALALCYSWTRPVVVVEADTAGPSVYPGLLGGNVPQDRGLTSLAVAAANGELASRLWPNTVTIPFPPAKGRSGPPRGLIPGVVSPVDAPALRDLWGPLGSVLASLEASGYDVIVDAGRIVATGDARDPLLAAADMVCVVTRSALTGVTGAVRLVEARVPLAERSTTTWRVLVVGEGRPYTTAEIAKQAALAPAGTIAWDPGAARVLSDGEPAPARFATSPLVRTAATVAADTVRAVAARRERLSVGERSAR